MGGAARNNVSAASGRHGPVPVWLRLLRTCLRAQWLVGGTCALAAIAYPQVEVYGCVAGAFLNAFLAKLLKRLIGQQRPMFRAPPQPPAIPPDAEGVVAVAGALVQEAVSEVAASAVDTALFAADTLGVEHPAPEPILAALPHPQLSEQHLGKGMPSSHAMSLFYFATYLTLAIYDSRDWQPVLSSEGVPQPPHPFVQLLQAHLPQWFLQSWAHGWARPAVVALLYTLVSLECWTRIRRRLHSPAQICVGALLGACVATVHTRFWMPLLREASKDVPPLAERTTEFKVALVAFMAVLAALTLERNTQRVAKRIVKGVLRAVTGKSGGKTHSK